MRVAQLTCVYPPYGGGIGEVARQYSSWLTAEHQVTVITPRYYPGMTFTSTPGVTVEAKRAVFTWGKAAWLKGLKKMLQSYEVVHLHYPFFGVQEQLSKALTKQKFILTYHMVPQANGLKGLAMRLSQKYSDHSLSMRAQVLTVATQDYLSSEAIPRLGENDKWQVLPFGVANQFHPGEAEEILLRRHQIKYGQAVILFVGTLDQAHYFKGLDILLTALAKLKDYNWKLVVVGGGTDKKRYEHQAKILGIAKDVSMAGYIKAEELPSYYRLASLLALPSINNAEAFGLVALEAMASGVPVVASRLPGVRELVQASETGILVQPEDSLALASAIESLLLNPQERRRLGNNAYQQVEKKYRWSIVGERLLEIYRNL